MRLCDCPKSYTSALGVRKNVLVKESCKTCGGRFLVDEIGPIATRMLSTAGLEVSNSINPELNWKPVTKGKRSRKPVARNVNGHAKPASRSPKRVGDFSVSDSDKFDELAIGRPPEEAVHIPLKKRRHLLQSPSPPESSNVHNEELLSAQPQTPSPHGDYWRSECTKHPKDFTGSAALKFGRGIDDDNISMTTDKKFYNPDDFSGIALLAAAACIDGLDQETSHVDVEEQSITEKSCASTSPSRITSFKSESRADTCSPQKRPFDDVGSVRSSTAPKVDRLHWDLNVVMDAWEQPLDDSVVGVSGVTDNNTKLENLDREGSKKSEDSQHCIQSHPLSCPTKQDRLEMDQGPTSSCKEMGPMHLDLDPAKSRNDQPTLDAENRSDAVSKSSLNISSWPPSNQVSPVSIDKEVHMESGNIGIMQEGAENVVKNLSLVNVKSGRENVGLSDVFASKSSSHEIYTDSFVGGVSRAISKMPDVSRNNLREVDHLTSPTKRQDLSSSGASMYSVVCNPKVSSLDDATAFGNVALKEPAYNYDNYRATEGEEKMSSNLEDSSRKDEGTQSDDPNSFSAKFGSTLEDCHNSDISQDEHSNMVASKDIIEMQAGYDSPYEDGELRMSTSCPWEELDIEDGETECVDYDSDDRGVDSCDADHPGSEIVEAGSEGSQGIEKKSLVAREALVSDLNLSGSHKISSRINYLKEDIEKIETDGNKSSVGSGSTNEQFERRRRRHASDHMDGGDMKDSRVDGRNSRMTGGKLQSHIEGPPSLERKDTGFMQQNRSIYSRPVRDFSSVKYMGRPRSTEVFEANRGNEQWGYWDSRNRYPSSYRGNDGHGYSRPRIADSACKFGGVSSQDHGQGLGYSSKGTRHMLGRRSPYERDDFYNVNRRGPAGRDTSMNANRRRSGNYSQGIGGGFREEYNELLPENRTLPSSRLRRYLSRRDRSFSPISGRVPQKSLARGRSRSRSRTRSPSAWHSQRERNPVLRHHSRSPDFRPEARLERRIPLQKSNFQANYSGRVMSPPRNRFSPQRNGRWFDDHDYVDNYPRERRSPVRMFRRGQRFDSVGPSGRLKSDELPFRPAMRPGGRFPPFSGTGRGGRKFDDRRQHGDRVENMHRTRHSDDAAVTGGRFRHDTEDSFDANNSHKEDNALSTTTMNPRNFPARTSPEEERSLKA